MKNRIVKTLQEISEGKSQRLVKELCDEIKITPFELYEKAGKVLYHLLHDYSHFSVVTIDSFFQKVIRSFAREMGLFAGYNVELDQTSVLDESIDLMMMEIDSNVFLKDWLVEWAEEKIRAGKSWNFKTDIHHLGHEIFSEKLQDMEPGLLQETTDRIRLEQFRSKLRKISDNYTAYLKEIGQRALYIMDDYGLTSYDFAQKERGIYGYFRRLANEQPANPNTYVRKALNDSEAWYSKSSNRKDDIEQAYLNGLNDALLDAYIYQTDNLQLITTAQEIQKQLNVLGILSDLIRHVNEYTRDQNLFLISEASGFLKTIIANADTPFIYERVGNFYNHFMIDEFQDTSSIQWDNFLPLIRNSLASGYHNWIVGDVKQSIYRWRNTDWKILSQQVENDLGSRNVEVMSLSRNWRSSPEIIQFNNAFFRDAVVHMCQVFRETEDKVDREYLDSLTGQMKDAYIDLYQKLGDKPEHSKGYIHLSFIPDDKKNGEPWEDQVLAQLPHRIEQLQDLGYKLSDIAILVRENKEAQIIADMLLAYSQANPQSGYRYDVLSNESLLVKNAPSVKWLVAALHFILDPSDQINKTYLQYEYQTYIKADDQTVLTGLSEKVLYHWRGLPVYELVDSLIQQFALYRNNSQAPFIQAFQDILLQYTRREATDVRSFLNWWDETKDKKFVTMPDNQDAIRLITIHKSKGLEFEAVIIPFCDWPLDKAGKLLWCEPQHEAFTDMKLLPLKFNPTLRNTYFVKEYLEEKMLSYVDNLNLLYVAFTRARKGLFISTPHQKKDEFAHIRDVIHHIFYQPVCRSIDEMWDAPPFIDLSRYWKADTYSFEMGCLEPLNLSPENIPTEQASYFSEPSREYIPHITHNSIYFSIDASAQYIQMDKGRLLHDIFRTISTTADLERSLNKLNTEGKILDSERSTILEMVNRALENPVVGEWFAPGKRIRTEIEILLPDGTTARLDRIISDGTTIQVVDYKFGQMESSKYQFQVRRYMEYLRSMGYTDIKGFLWYVMLNKVEEIIF